MASVAQLRRKSCYHDVVLACRGSLLTRAASRHAPSGTRQCMNAICALHSENRSSPSKAADIKTRRVRNIHRRSTYMSSVSTSEGERTVYKAADLHYVTGVAVAWQRFRNTFLQAPILFDLILSDKSFDDMLSQRRNSRITLQRLMEKCFWFWPRIVDAKLWAQGAEGRLKTPLSFTDLDFASKLLLNEVMRYAPDPRSAILDVGCNCGRDLDALYQAGYRNLAGVDAMGSALDFFKRKFPETAKCANISHDLFQRFLRKQGNRSYDLIYSHGRTLELVHPSFDIVRHLCRVARSHVVLYVYEYGEAYPRFWIYEFRRCGFYLVKAERPASQFSSVETQGSLLVFQRI
jgi:SAM-dependent methyltransferase